MSPNEFQLRAALREGEGDGVDVDAVLAGAAEIRRRRRRTISSISGGVAVAALIGVGGTLIATNAGGGESGGGGNIAASVNSSAATAPARGGGGSQQMLPYGGKGSRGVGPLAKGSTGSSGSCPARPAQLALPAAGTPNASGPLFDRPVARMTLCGYGFGPTDIQHGSRELSGAAAARLVASLDRADASPEHTCVSRAAPSSVRLEIIATSADGAKLAPVTVSFPCGFHGNVVTNGTAVRYNWTPPRFLQPLTGLNSD